MYCTVVTTSRSRGIGNGLTYETAELNVQPGFPVRVPLRNKLVEGIVTDVLEKRKEDEYDLKNVQEILGDLPFLTRAQLKTAQWMSDYYFCTLRQALGVWLPAQPWSRILPRKLIGYTLQSPDAEAKGRKQQAVLDYLRGKEWTSREELMKEVSVNADTLNTLKKKGWLHEEVRREIPVHVQKNLSSPLRNLPTLTPAQEAAFEAIKQDERPSLLFGVTSSGKTEIYMQLIAETIKEGRQAILLVPEILLTEQTIDRLAAVVDRQAIAVIHSKLKESARRKEWSRIHHGEVSLVIGSRSALFSPLSNLGLVILDEEHEWTYKNEQTPRYHTRETAETLCKFAGAKLVLGTATPSLESWSRAKQGTYHLARLPLRFGDMPLPNVRIIDLAETQFGKLYPFSKPLLDAINERLQKQEQCVLFLNRRGVASSILCLHCRRRIICPASQLPYTLHHTRNGRPYLLDHTSGLIAEVPAQCPHCQSTDLLPIGAGTQKIEMILGKIFPQARLLRADSDTLKSADDMRSVLGAMRERQADILLGTQLVVKGLDLPHVTLAAVLLADIGLSLPHFRAGERVFQLLTQLTGRSGRARPGEVIIQTFRPSAPEVLFAATHETEKYLDTELKLRTWGEYPPSRSMIRLLLHGKDAATRAKALQNEALHVAENQQEDVKVFAAPTFFGGGNEWQVLLRGPVPASVLPSLDLHEVGVDVDPVETA